MNFWTVKDGTLVIADGFVQQQIVDHPGEPHAWSEASGIGTQDGPLPPFRFCACGVVELLAA
jgi:hypothetical protein